MVRKDTHKRWLVTKIILLLCECACSSPPAVWWLCVAVVHTVLLVLQLHTTVLQHD
jgi:hypothetical protein